jgi:hypothetical protein
MQFDGRPGRWGVSKVDEVEAQYRRIARAFIVRSNRTPSAELTTLYLNLAKHYRMLADLHQKYSATPFDYRNIRRQERIMPAEPRDPDDGSR